MHTSNIPSDTPESTVMAILAILGEETDQVGATFEVQQGRIGTATHVTINITLGPQKFRMFLSYVESGNLHTIASSVGSGWITTTSGSWNLALLPKDPFPAPLAPPFRWGLYHPSSDVTHHPPFLVLDGVLLRRLLLDSLSSPPTASP